MKKKKWIQVVFKRRVLVILLLSVQVALIALLLAGTGIYFDYAYLFLNFLSIIVCIHVFNKHEKAAYKLSWVFLILLFPFFGGIMYIFFYSQSNPKKLKRMLERNIRDSQEALRLPGNRLPDLIRAHPEFGTQAHYLQEFAGYPVYANTRQEYFDSGEAFFHRVLEELEKAEHYIFLEFFILREGVMLNPVLSILEKKAAQGLDVRVIYDDLGCFMTLPADFHETLEHKGIKCFIFNPFRPIVSSLQNNRDHRKIISIDGKIAFTGGLNLADEYINAVERFGHWKDAAIMLEGEGAWSLTLIAKSGVDVRIITPHRWDKWIVAITSRSYYRRLIQAGVKVYEYTSGFNHGKTFVSDDKVATVGTTNLDFRSLYLHFECGVLIYNSETVAAIKDDFLRTLPDSHQVSLQECAKNAFQRIVPDVLRIIAPLI